MYEPDACFVALWGRCAKKERCVRPRDHVALCPRASADEVATEPAQKRSAVENDAVKNGSPGAWTA
jgi:hypothetical protein